MYICIYVDLLLVALIIEVGFCRARCFRTGWIVLVLGCFGRGFRAPKVIGELWASNFGIQGRLCASNFGC